MGWFPLACLIGLLFGAYNFLVKIAAPGIHEVLGAVVLQWVAAVAGTAALFVLCRNELPLAWTNRGVFWSAAAGVCVALAEALSFFLFSKGAPVSSAMPVVVGVSVVSCAVLGFLVLGEILRGVQLAGILCIAVGVALLMMQQGE